MGKEYCQEILLVISELKIAIKNAVELLCPPTEGFFINGTHGTKYPV
ncbi:MAG: hypothetical protein JWO06_1605 [Bacteroidota bacterium]|jgi:hypothetical protein|nr:hypothetical protein [Bacteroidota bacterium]